MQKYNKKIGIEQIRQEIPYGSQKIISQKTKLNPRTIRAFLEGKNIRHENVLKIVKAIKEIKEEQQQAFQEVINN